jgi:hypothetical protein
VAFHARHCPTAGGLTAGGQDHGGFGVRGQLGETLHVGFDGNVLAVQQTPSEVDIHQAAQQIQTVGGIDAFGQKILNPRWRVRVPGRLEAVQEGIQGILRRAVHAGEPLGVQAVRDAAALPAIFPRLMNLPCHLAGRNDFPWGGKDAFGAHSTRMPRRGK